MKLGLGLRAEAHRVRDEITYFAANAFGKPRLYDLKSPERVGCVYKEPSDMCSTDRLMLYALVRGLRPKYALEIGVRWGNSARIITNAMEENGVGKLVGLDPAPEAFRATAPELHGHYTLIKGYSPEAVPEAAKALGTPIDFAFIDALHIYDAVLNDFRAVLPCERDAGALKKLGEPCELLQGDAQHLPFIKPAREAAYSETDPPRPGCPNLEDDGDPARVSWPAARISLERFPPASPQIVQDRKHPRLESKFRKILKYLERAKGFEP